MKRLYEKNALTFALVWIGVYVVVMNLALRFCGGFDELGQKTLPQVLVPVVCILTLAAILTVWILRSGLAEVFGLCRFRGDPKAWLWFLPLAAMSCTNLKNGLTLPAALAVSALMAVNLAVGGYVEELIFRGFLFRAMCRENLRSAIIVSAVTFGVGHIVNVFNTADLLGVLLQVCYAIAIGFLYTVIAYKGGSLWPGILSHVFVNGTSVFAREEGVFTDLVYAILGRSAINAPEIISAALIILISSGYAWWIWKKA
ncbi:MAG: CPBP family intramembrane metalloprotease [Oscillospiraceae bacterium]|nr:CPBP family intramembrane metalloprotease [Oscillospiraceae bacterium]